MIVETEGHPDSPPTDEPDLGRRFRVAARTVYLALAVVVQIAIYDLVIRIVRVGDLVAIGMPLALPIVLLILAIIAVFRRWRVLIAATTTLAALLCVLIAPRLPDWSSPPAASTALQVMAVNLQHDNRDRSSALTAVNEIDPDIVVVSELTRISNRVLTVRYEHAARVWGEGNGEGLFSNVPFELLGKTPQLEELATLVGHQLVAARFESPEPFVLLAVHPPRPVLEFEGQVGTTTFAEHRRMIEKLDEFADSQDLPVVIAGDLNLSDRTHGYRVISAGRTDVARARSLARSTYFGGRWGLLHLRIDYVLVSDTWCAGDGRRVSIPGSDHKAVVGEIGPCE